MLEVKGVLKWRHAVHREKYVRMKLESPFGEDVIPTGIQGKRNVVTSRSTAEKILWRLLKSAMEKDEGEMKHTNSSKATAC